MMAAACCMLHAKTPFLLLQHPSSNVLPPTSFQRPNSQMSQTCVPNVLNISNIPNFLNIPNVPNVPNVLNVSNVSNVSTMETGNGNWQRKQATETGNGNG